MILTINEIIKRFRTEGQCYKFSSTTIKYMALKLGYSLRRIGGKIGYDQSLLTAITRHFREAVEYDKAVREKTPQKTLKQPIDGDYYTYNGERDNKDYEWEKNESKHMKKNRIIKEGRNVMTGLWLDDSRHDPVNFLNKKDNDKGKQESGAIVRDWYRQNMNGVDIQWTAVPNYWEFKNYILNNGVPDFVSLDHDLGRDSKTGALRDSGQYAPTGTDCALFLTSYCFRNHIPLPKHYIHSANDNQRVFISKVFKLAKMGKDPLEGIDLNNDQEIAQAADNFRHGIVATKDMVKKGQLGTADRLARMRGLKDTNKLFKDKKDIFRENKNNGIKKLIRLTESDLHGIIKESVRRILKQYNYDITY